LICWLDYLPLVCWRASNDNSFVIIVISMMNRENNLSNIINTVTSWFKNEFFTIFKKKKKIDLIFTYQHRRHMTTTWYGWMNFPAILKIYLLAQMWTASTKCFTHLKAIIIVVVGTLQIPNQYKQNGKSSTLAFFFFFPSQIENSNFGIFFWLIDWSIN